MQPAFRPGYLSTICEASMLKTGFQHQGHLSCWAPRLTWVTSIFPSTSKLPSGITLPRLSLCSKQQSSTAAVCGLSWAAQVISLELLIRRSLANISTGSIASARNMTRLQPGEKMLSNIPVPGGQIGTNGCRQSPAAKCQREKLVAANSSRWNPRQAHTSRYDLKRIGLPRRLDC